MRPHEFWGSTPHETMVFCLACGRAEMGRFRRALWEAWHTAAFQRTKRMPNLGVMLRKLGGPEERKQTVGEVLQQVEWITAASRAQAEAAERN